MSGKNVTKQSLIPIWEKNNIEAYYSHMAGEGYFIKDKTMLFEEFIKKAGEDRRYVVLLHNNLTDEEVGALKQTGWEKSFWHDDCLVISTNQEGTPLPFEDDVALWSIYLKKKEKERKEFGIGFTAAIVMVLIALASDFAMTEGLLLWIAGYLLFGALKCFMKQDRARKVRQEVFWGKKDSRDWMGVQRRDQHYWIIFFIFMLAHIIYYI